MNPFTTLPKLIKSKPLLDKLQKEVQTMSKSNWKTNTLGAIALVIGLAQIWAPASYQPNINKTVAILTGVGLLAAKDADNVK